MTNILVSVDSNRRKGLRRFTFCKLTSRWHCCAAREIRWYALYLRALLSGPYPYFTAGKDATDAFFGLHRHEVLLRPQYARLQIGTLSGEHELVKPSAPDAPSAVPYAEPSWLVDGFSSPFYSEGHRRFQRAVRKFVNEIIAPEMEQCEQNGKKIGQGVIDRMA